MGEWDVIRIGSTYFDDQATYNQSYHQIKAKNGKLQSGGRDGRMMPYI